MSEGKSFADKAVDVLLRSLRTVFNERVVSAAERLILQARESFAGQEVILEPSLQYVSDRNINVKTTLPWLLSNSEKAKIDFSSIDFASQNNLGVGTAESEDVDIEAMIDATKRALSFLQKQVRFQSANVISVARTKRDEINRARQERATEKVRVREENLLTKSLEEAEKKRVDSSVRPVEKIQESQISNTNQPVEFERDLPAEPQTIEVSQSFETPLEIEPPMEAKPVKPPKQPKPPKASRPPRVKREFKFPKPSVKSIRIALGALSITGIAVAVFLVIDRQNSSSDGVPQSETSTTVSSTSDASTQDQDLLGDGSYDVGTITSDDFNRLSSSEKIAYATFFHTPDLSESEILLVLAGLEKQFRSCLGRGEARPTNCPIVEDRINVRSIKWKWIQSVRPQFVQRDDGRIYAEVEYAAANSGLYRKGNKNVKFNDFDAGNKVALISILNGKVSVTWNP